MPFFALMSRPIARHEAMLDQPRSSNANRRCLIYAEIIARATPLANNSRHCAGAALSLEKNLRVHFPHLRIADSLFPEFASHDFVAINLAGTIACCANYRSCRVAFSTVPSSKHWSAIAARTCSLSLCLMNSFANPKFQLAGVRSSNQMTRLSWSANRSGRKARRKNGFMC